MFQDQLYHFHQIKALELCEFKRTASFDDNKKCKLMKEKGTN